MSGDDFIYSAIADDNVSAFDLNVIASTLASTDKLVRQHKQQQEENERLREKITSLRESALQIKALYETEQARAARAETQLASYASQCKQLEERCLIADSDKINADLILTERLAEKERQQEEKERRYQSLITDLVRYFSLPGDPGDSGKKCELKQHLPTVDLLNLPDDVKAFIQQAPNHRSKRRRGRTRSVATVDQECQTVPVEVRNGSTNTATEQQQQQQVRPERPELRDCGTDAYDMMLQEQHGKAMAEKEQQTVGKTFCDKATMHSMSTITRATCTSVFIKRVDVGVNFPEVIHKSVDDILRECVPLPPLLLSPIADFLPLCETVSTQTDAEPEPTQKPSLVTCGTMTSLRNIRKRIDYRTAEGGMTAFQQQYTSVAEQLFGKIKKEDYPASPGFGFEADDTFGAMHPHLSTIWTMLGDSIFMLLSSGRRFDSQCYSVLNEQLTTIRDMLEADGRRESELMSSMFSDVRATVVAAAGYGKERSSTATTTPGAPNGGRARAGPSREPTPDRVPVDDCSVVVVEKEIVPASPTKEISNSDAEVVLVEGVTVSSSSPPALLIARKECNETRGEVAQSIVTNDAETVSQNGSEQMKDRCISLAATPEKTSPVTDEEVDRIALQLQMMEDEEIVDPVRTSSPIPSALDAPASQTQSSLEEATSVPEPDVIPTSTVVAAEPAEQSPPVPRPSTPPSEAPLAGSLYPPNTTETFVSPIKVKETNQLVKDQFKTPTQPPISKRKLRIRRSDEGTSSASALPHASKRLRLSSPEPGSGRTSPTTEFLLEDDWDQKFSSIKAAMMGSLCDVDCRPLSPIADRCEEHDGLDLEKELDDDLEAAVAMEAVEDSSTPKESVEVEAEETVVPEVAPATIVSSIIGRIVEEKDSIVSSNVGKDLANKPEVVVPPAENSISEKTNERAEKVDLQVQQEQETVIENASENGKSTANDVTDHTIEAAMNDGEVAEDIADDLNSTGELVIDIDIDNDTAPEVGCSNTADVWDSPMSPPTHETGLSITIPSEHHLPVGPLTDSPLSPPLPSDREPTTSLPPPRIPLFHVDLHQHLQQQQQQEREREEPIYKFIALHDNEKWKESSQKVAGRASSQEQQALSKLAELLTAYLQNPAWTEEVVNETLTKVLNVTHDVRLISLAILQLVISCEDMTVNMICSPPAPPLPLTQQKLILIVRHLGYGLATLESVLMRELDRRMFQLKSNTLSVPELIALTFLYIGMEDSKPSDMPWKRPYSVRLFIFKCMYYFGFKCLPLIYYVLRAFPFALPKAGSPHYDNADAMIATIRTILMNMNYNTDRFVAAADESLYRKRELLWLLRKTYGYQLQSPTYDELVVNLVEKIRANKLRNVAHALILVAKRNGYDWARLNIIQKRIYPLLNEYLKQFEQMRASCSFPVSGGASGSCSSSVVLPDSGSSNTVAGSLDDRIVTCIFTIASIMKTQPSNEDASRVMQIFTTIVQLAEGNRAIQEEAIAGLIKFSRFGFVDVFQRLSLWCPDYSISDRMKLMLTTMVGRKPPQFWKQLMENRIV